MKTITAAGHEAVGSLVLLLCHWNIKLELIGMFAGTFAC
jgi:hypothetical protein